MDDRRQVSISVGVDGAAGHADAPPERNPYHTLGESSVIVFDSTFTSSGAGCGVLRIVNYTIIIVNYIIILFTYSFVYMHFT